MTPFSEYAMHVLVDETDSPVSVQEAIERSMGHRIQDQPATEIPHHGKLTAQQLLQLGAIWYLPHAHYQHNMLELPHSSYKPQRLSLSNATTKLQMGDYLRIHHTPRRFPRVYTADWKQPDVTSESVIVQSGHGFWIIDKPPGIPVHATVDNVVENVSHQLKQANQADYVVTTQRLDVNTSGLLVVATNLEFAAYFAKLLRQKTKRRGDSIVKGYRCLVCVPHTAEESVTQAWERLSSLQNHTIRHYLERSDRAPKRFEPHIPKSEEPTDGQWLECLLKITKVSPPHPLSDNEESGLVQALWTTMEMPTHIRAVCEVEIRLETGRTHQIRGQLARLGFPLVGDELYHGATPQQGDTKPSGEPQLLALQCSLVGFADADYIETWNRRRRRNVTQGTPSDRWIEASLSKAWWTPMLEQSHASVERAV